VQEGDVAALEAAVREVAPGLLDDNIKLLFDLRRCRYVQLVDCAATVDALRYARRELAPLADADPSLQPEISVRR
jgi:hypothetical protein